MTTLTKLLPKSSLNFALSALIFFSITSVCRADTVSFDFNSLADNANNASVQSYIQAILTAAGLGTVAVSGAVAEKDYNGDNHVVGGTFSGTNYSNTLGTSDGATGPLNGQRSPSTAKDTFLVNNTEVHTGTDSDRILLTFTLPVNFKIQSLSFDYEIFPDSTCPSSSNCPSAPDFKFYADNNLKFTKLSSAPVSPDGNNSPLSNTEQAWQFIGVSGLQVINDSNNVTKLEFVDWPVMIGIDNLTLNYTRPPGSPQQVPEPSSMLLLGLGFLGLGRQLVGQRAKYEA